MADLRYLIPRFIRHILPENIVHYLLTHSLIIRPGLETRAPFEAADRYLEAIKSYGLDVSGRRVLIFGYGGNFAVACRLLEAGAVHIILSERAGFRQLPNKALLPKYEAYLEETNGLVFPRHEFFTLIHGDIRTIAARGQTAPVDLVFSSSVFEHLNDVPGITRALALLTRSAGAQIHFIDLRDHYFKYPFEMLCYTEETWKKWLNPSSNLNRYRLWDYSRTFDQFFEQVKIDILEQDAASFNKIRPRIRPEFLGSDPQQNAATQIQAFVRYPCVSAEDA